MAECGFEVLAHGEDVHIRGPEMKSCSVQDAWMMGLRIGVIGGSDGHNLFGDRIQGLTGVYATELSRAGIFEAIRKRHCYATTGDPIELEFRVNGHLMGSEIDFRESGNVVRLQISAPYGVITEKDVEAIERQLSSDLGKKVDVEVSLIQYQLVTFEEEEETP